MLPQVSVGRRCGAMLVNVRNDRMLISENLSEALFRSHMICSMFGSVSG